MKHITTIKIPALKGTKVIAESKLFSWIDSDFTNWKADEKGKPTKAMNLDIFEMDTDATFAQIMSPDNLLTQEQILYFVEKHKDLLRQDGYATFFPFKSNGEIFVARVRVGSDGLEVGASRFSDDRVWRAVGRRRFVVPQLATEKFTGSNDPLKLSSSDTLSLSDLSILKSARDVIDRLVATYEKK